MNVDKFNALKGKTVASVEVSDNEVLIAFTDGSEITITHETTGGDYGATVLSAVVSEPTHPVEPYHRNPLTANETKLRDALTRLAAVADKCIPEPAEGLSNQELAEAEEAIAGAYRALTETEETKSK